MPGESCWRGVLAAGVANGPGWRVRVVPNREPALRVEGTLGEDRGSLLQSWGGLGAHEVVIESADHRATLGTMSVDDIWRVLWAWRERIRDLRRDTRLRTFSSSRTSAPRRGRRSIIRTRRFSRLPFSPPAI